MSFLKPPLPKEHGSWAMLTIPLALGAAIAPVWQWRVVILFVAALGFFLVRFPLATLVKTRKRGTTQAPFLWRWAAIYAVISAGAGGWLVLNQTLWWLAAMGVFGTALVGFHLWLVARRQEMSAVGELAGIMGLTLGAPMAYYVSSGSLDGTAITLWIINALYFGGTVYYIKLKVRQQPRFPKPNKITERLVKAKACLAYQTVALSVVLLFAALRWMPSLAPLAFVPMTLKVLRGAWQWQDRKSLNLVHLGLVEVFHSLAFAVLVIVAFR